ncbi:MAG: hypothetical protein P8X73_07535 [Ignavibacteriaceae bacterium]
MNTQVKILIISIVCQLVISISCDSEHGIAPKLIGKQEFGFGGNIVFYGAWPDSIKRMVLIVFKDPLIDTDDFVLQNIGLLSFELPLNVQTFQYSSTDSTIIPLIPDDASPSVYHYVAVAQQSTDDISLSRKDWFVSGVYYVQGDTSSPGILTIPDDTYIENINIYCDFDNPPPQPPGGN